MEKEMAYLSVDHWMFKSRASDKPKGNNLFIYLPASSCMRLQWTHVYWNCLYAKHAGAWGCRDE